VTHVNQSETMLTASELAHLLNVHINTVRRWSNRGILKVYRIGPRGDRRFSKEDIDSFLAENPEVKYRNGKVLVR
jgi:excisionase family DNA binding protein